MAYGLYFNPILDILIIILTLLLRKQMISLYNKKRKTHLNCFPACIENGFNWTEHLRHCKTEKWMLLLGYTAHSWLHSLAFFWCLNGKEKAPLLPLFLFLLYFSLFSLIPVGRFFFQSWIFTSCLLSLLSFSLPKATHWQHFTDIQLSGWISSLIIWCEASRGRPGSLLEFAERQAVFI